MSDDHSPGDGRKPYSDSGGAEARHAQTHDVERERLTNPTGPEPEDTSFAEQLAPSTPDSIREAQTEGTPASGDRGVMNALPDLRNDELASLTVLDPTTPLEQGSVYLDLEDPNRAPFTATGGQTAGAIGRVIAKKTTDYEIWNRLTGEERN